MNTYKIVDFDELDAVDEALEKGVQWCDDLVSTQDAKIWFCEEAKIPVNRFESWNDLVNKANDLHGEQFYLEADGIYTDEQ